MTTRLVNALFAALFLVITTQWATAQVPAAVTWQAYLTDASGQSITAATDVTASLYAVPSGGAPLWADTKTAACLWAMMIDTSGKDNIRPIPAALDTILSIDGVVYELLEGKLGPEPEYRTADEESDRVNQIGIDAVHGRCR